MAVRLGRQTVVSVMENYVSKTRPSTPGAGGASVTAEGANPQGMGTDKELVELVVLLSEVVASMTSNSGHAGRLRTLAYSVKKRHGL